MKEINNLFEKIKNLNLFGRFKNLLEKFKMMDVMKKKRLLLVSGGILAVVVLVFVISGLFSENSFLTAKNEDGIKFANEYEKLNNQEFEEGKKYPKVEIPNDNIIKYASVKDIINIFKSNGDAVVYFGYSTCLYCRNAIQVLIDANSSYGSELDVIYYINIEEVWDEYKIDENGKVVKTKEADSNYYELLDLLGKELVYDYKLKNSSGKEVAVGVKRIDVPLVIFMTDGRVSSYNKGTLFSQEDPLVEMDESQKKGLGEIYSYGIKDVVTAKKNKGLIK